MKNLLLILSCLFVLGCGNSLKNSWNDFRAYYNTYYNAQENFRAGIQKIQEQPISIDPMEPVRIHQEPVQAGNSDFQKAIDKGAKILRKFPASKWADDALLLIGKSYYYRQEFYPALQKFEELRNVSAAPKMEQSAIIWKGRTQLDLKLYSEGASFLESELNVYPNDWSSERKAEIKALAGEHHAMQENWEQSSDFLSEAVTGIANKKLLGRTLFLYGQVLERLERYGEAYFAFSRVSENFPGFEYIFWARFKQADVARKDGNLDEAIAIYEELRNDDKNMHRRNELTFEIARTLEMKGKAAEAETLYKKLLYSDRAQQKRSIKADIYYRLGKIYSDQYDNYQVASAYFDSSSTTSDALKRIDDTEDPQSLADAFGRYTRLQQTINRADSLLWLGSLSEAELSSALDRIRAQKRQALRKELESDAQNTLVNRNTVAGESSGSTTSENFGFLNHRNNRLATQAKGEFKVIWGDRPLIDNWRRMEVVRQASVQSQSSQTTETGNQAIAEERAAIEMNLDDIPRNLQAENELKAEKVNAQYELGNLLFLNLNLPDSAAYYFREVVKNDVARKLRPRAMYSLFELYNNRENQDSLQFWGERILQEFPDSRYARRVKNELEGGQQKNQSVEQDSTSKLRQEFQELLSLETSAKASKLRKLALENRSSELAPHIYYQSIEAYIQEAKTLDSVSTDTMQSISKMKGRLSFDGARWDSVRLVVEEFDTTFPEAQQHKRVAKLQELLEKSEPPTKIATCKALGISLAVQPSMDEFLSTIVYPEELKGASISGKIIYSFVVNGAGEIKSYELVSQKTSLGIEEAFEEAFEKSLQFSPLSLEDPPARIKCEVSFPIKR